MEANVEADTDADVDADADSGQIDRRRRAWKGTRR